MGYRVSIGAHSVERFSSLRSGLSLQPGGRQIHVGEAGNSPNLNPWDIKESSGRIAMDQITSRFLSWQSRPIETDVTLALGV